MRAVKGSLGHSPRDWKDLTPSAKLALSPSSPIAVRNSSRRHSNLRRLVRVGQTVCPRPAGRNRLRANREIGRENGRVFLWAVIDTDPRNADDLSALQSPESWLSQG